MSRVRIDNRYKRGSRKEEVGRRKYGGGGWKG
jgi:hypothetical protein